MMTIPVTAILPVSEEALVVGDERGIVSIIGMNGSPVTRLEELAGAPILSMALSHDGTLLMASNKDGRAVVWDRTTGAAVDDMRDEFGAVQCAILKRHQYVTVSRSRGAFWSRNQHGDIVREPIAGAGGSPLTVHAVAVTGEDLLLLSGFTWILWNTGRRAMLDSDTPADASAFLYMDGAVGISADGGFYYIYWDDFLLFDIPGHALIRRHPILIHATSTALSNDGERLVIGGRNGAIAVMDAVGRPMMEAAPAETDITQVALTADARIAAFIDDEGKAGVFEVETGAMLIDYEKIMAAISG